MKDIVKYVEAGAMIGAIYAAIETIGWSLILLFGGGVTFTTIAGLYIILFILGVIWLPYLLILVICKFIQKAISFRGKE